jgi:hypothetical protein
MRLTQTILRNQNNTFRSRVMRYRNSWHQLAFSHLFSAQLLLQESYQTSRRKGSDTIYEIAVPTALISRVRFAGSKFLPIFFAHVPTTSPKQHKLPLLPPPRPLLTQITTTTASALTPPHRTPIAARPSPRCPQSKRRAVCPRTGTRCCTRQMIVSPPFSRFSSVCR